jgi:aerobic-type carbon monoxide dehydrogenase small subunit (CoxS/CutS family)
VTETFIQFQLDREQVSVPVEGLTLLEVLRDRLGVRSVKDGCSPQGQCGCCTVWVDGQPRVACVTPSARVAGRSVTTLEGLPDANSWATQMCDSGASQCGFCTPGIIMRLAAIPVAQRSPATVGQALLAHLCRCTGWNSIIDAAGATAAPLAPSRNLGDAARRAAIEGGAAQHVSPEVALGHGGFAADTAPVDSLVAVLGADGEWMVGATATDARRAAGSLPGRRTTEPLRWPIDLPEGDWVRTLQTTWVEPAYLEPDAAWCEPGGEPVGPLPNGGAFGGKVHSEVAAAARRLADAHGRTVLALYGRGDIVRRGPKRPPLAMGVRADGTGVVRVVRTPGIAEAIRSFAASFEVEEIDVPGPPTSAAMRAAGWAEVAALLATDDGWITAPNGARARAVVADDGSVQVEVECGLPLDEVVLRSYCVGAAHMALGWVRHEGIAVNDGGDPIDLTIRSFGVLRAVDMPRCEVRIVASHASPVNGSDAVFAAVASAAWRAAGFAPRWPTMRT